MKWFNSLSTARKRADRIIANYHGKVTPEEIGQFIDVLQIDRCVDILKQSSGETILKEDQMRMKKLSEIRGAT